MLSSAPKAPGVVDVLVQMARLSLAPVSSEASQIYPKKPSAIPSQSTFQNTLNIDFSGSPIKSLKSKSSQNTPTKKRSRILVVGRGGVWHSDSMHSPSKVSKKKKKENKKRANEDLNVIELIEQFKVL